ncbi:MAG: hypothetical protein PHR36_02880 [Patescibacteria group bacterium]|nr:hypothetical protein [Patescibacteria group bacterium]
MSACEEIRKVRFSSDQLLRWLEDQGKRLTQFGYHKALGMTQENFLIYIRETSGKQIPLFVEVEERKLPTLLVIPDDVLRFEIQLELLGIQSNHRRPILNNDEMITPSQPHLIFGAEYFGLGDISVERAVLYQKSNLWQVLTFAQGLAMVAQFDKLREYCEGLIFAGSYWFERQVRLVPKYSCREEERSIMGHVAQASCCGLRFGLREKEPIITSAGSREGLIAEASREA